MIWSLEGTATVLAQISIIRFRRSQIECMKHLAERSWRGKLRDTSSSWTNRWLDTWRTCRERCPVGRWDSALLLGRTFITYQRLKWLKRLKTYYDDLRCIEIISMCGWHGYVFSIPSHLQEMCHAWGAFLARSSLERLHPVTSQLTRTRHHSEDKNVAACGSQTDKKGRLQRQACLVKRHVCRLMSFFKMDWLANWHVIQRFDYTYQFQQYWHYDNSLATPLEAVLKKNRRKLLFGPFFDTFIILYLKFWEMTATL